PTCLRVTGGGDGLVEHDGGLVDGALDGRLDDGLAGETLAVTHTDVGGEDDGVRVPDEGRVQGLGGGGTLGLDVEFDVLAGGGRLRQGVGGHVGVGDAGGAGGDRDEAGHLLPDVLGVVSGFRV